MLYLCLTGGYVIHPNKTIGVLGIFIGSIVGSNFGLPFVYAKSGLVIGLLVLVVLAVLITILQLMMAEVALQTQIRHRFIGYIGAYLGHHWKRIAMLAFAIAIFGSMTAYVIVAGGFLSVLLSPIFGGKEVVYGVVFALIANALIYRGIHFASRFEAVLTSVLIFLFVFVVLASLPYVQVNNLLTVNWKQAFLPYGVTLFSLAGIGVVPELRAVLGWQARRSLSHLIVVGMVMITLSMAFTAVVGVTGGYTPNALMALSQC